VRQFFYSFSHFEAWIANKEFTVKGNLNVSEDKLDEKEVIAQVSVTSYPRSVSQTDCSLRYRKHTRPFLLA
jgi:hypothetical protein